MDQGIVNSGGSTTTTAATERLSETLRVNNAELYSVKDLWASSTNL